MKKMDIGICKYKQNNFNLKMFKPTIQLVNDITYPISSRFDKFST